MPPQSQPDTAVKNDVVRLTVAPDGEVISNEKDLPLKVIVEQTGWKRALRLAFDPQGNTLYVQDGIEWHNPISNGDEAAWEFLNASLRHIRANYELQPALRFGEPPGSVQKKALSEFPAWAKIRGYVWSELRTVAKDLPVVEFVPSGPMHRTAFFEPSGTAEGIEAGGPAIFINRNMGPYGQPDYDKINKILFDQYLTHLAELHPQEVEKSAGPDHEVYFAYREDGRTKVLKAKSKQQNRVIDEDSLKREPGLQAKRPVMFHFIPESKRIVLLNQSRRQMRKYKDTEDTLNDIRRIMAKQAGCSEHEIIISHNDMLTRPFVSSTANYPIVEHYLDATFGQQHPKLPVLESPLTKDGSKDALLVTNLADEESIPECRRQRIKHGIMLQYPFIAVESRMQDQGAKSRAILFEYAKINKTLVEKDPAGSLLEGHEATVRLECPDAAKHVERIARFMLEMGEGPKSVLDFFANRGDAVRRARLMEMLKPVFEIHDQEVESRRQSIEKTASLDVGINDWQKYGLQEQLNSVQQVNDPTKPKPQVMPFNLKQMKKRTSPATIGTLLTRDHDKELNCMKPMEQLLGESRI